MLVLYSLWNFGCNRAHKAHLGQTLVYHRCQQLSESKRRGLVRGKVRTAFGLEILIKPQGRFGCCPQTKCHSIDCVPAGAAILNSVSEHGFAELWHFIARSLLIQTPVMLYKIDSRVLCKLTIVAEFHVQAFLQIVGSQDHLKQGYHFLLC